MRAKEKVRNAQNTAEAQRRILREPACRKAEWSIGAHSEKGYFAHFMWMYIRTYTDKEKTKGAGGGVGDPSVGKASQIQIPSIPQRPGGRGRPPTIPLLRRSWRETG